MVLRSGVISVAMNQPDVFRGSSEVERLIVNQNVVGSIPTLGAKVCFDGWLHE